MRRHVRSVVGLFHTDPPQLCGWSLYRESKHRPRSRLQVFSHGRQGKTWLQSGKPENYIHREDYLIWVKLHSIMARSNCMHRGVEREWQIDSSVYVTVVWVAKLLLCWLTIICATEHCDEISVWRTLYSRKKRANKGLPCWLPVMT